MSEINAVDAKSLELLNKAIEVISQSTEEEPMATEVGDALLDCVNWFYRDCYEAGDLDCALFGQGTIDYYLQSTAIFSKWIEERYVDHKDAKSNTVKGLNVMITNLTTEN